MMKSLSELFDMNGGRVRRLQLPVLSRLLIVSGSAYFFYSIQNRTLATRIVNENMETVGDVSIL